MGIVKMKRLRLLAQQKERVLLLNLLMEIGAIEVCQTTTEFEDISVRPGLEDEFSRYTAQLEHFERAIDHIKEIQKGKGSFLSGMHQISKDELNSFSDDHKMTKCFSAAKMLTEYQEQIASLEERESYLRLELKRFDPWKDIDANTLLLKQNWVRVYAGSFDDAESYAQTNQYFKEKGDAVQLDLIDTIDVDPIRVFITCLASKREEVILVAKNHGFHEIKSIDNTFSLAQSYTKIKKDLKTIEDTRIMLERKSEALSKYRKDFEICSDYLRIELDKLEVEKKWVETKDYIILSGFVPEVLIPELENKLKSVSKLDIQYEDIELAGEYPIYLHNPKLVQPYESVVSMYGEPMAFEIDPTVFIAPFYACFFGMMFSDLAYGLILTLLTFIAIKKNLVKGETIKTVKMLFQCGLFTMFWGLLFGGFFGDFITAVTDGKFDFPTLWVNVFDDPVEMMKICLVFGLIHMIVGMGIKGYMYYAMDKAKDALFDILPWMLILSGIILLIINLAQFAIYPVGVGLLIILLFAGRGTRNPIVRVGKGLLGVFGFVAYLSDILSYTRILALSMATGIIGMVFNKLGMMVAKNIVGIVFAFLIMGVGHLMNFMLSSLSAYVHTTRLQYVEFFGKFYTGGGKPWDPFMEKTKYVELAKTNLVPNKSASMKERIENLILFKNRVN